jgi:hypothetical protein
MSVHPNFFLVGAPRCGTTAMYTYLSQHPDFGAALYEKEPHYFGTDLDGPRFRRFRYKESKYLRLFEHVQDRKRIGEASVLYLVSKRAAQEIYDFNSDAKILIMLRNPADMLFSWYHRLKSNTHEPLQSFEEALAAESNRKAGRGLPKNFYLMPEALFYRYMAQFAEQVERYFDVFGREAVKVIIYDDFNQDTAGIYRETLQFLEINEEFKTDFSPLNSAQGFRSPFLRRLMANKTLVHLGDKFYPIAMPFYRNLMKMNKQPAERPVFNPETRRYLIDELQPEIDKLGILLDRDLSYWYD